MTAIKSIRELARKAADKDGRRKGLTQKESEFVLKLATDILAEHEASGKYEGSLARFNKSIERKIKKAKNK